MAGVRKLFSYYPRFWALIRLQLQNFRIIRNFWFRKSQHTYKDKDKIFPVVDVSVRQTSFYDMELNFLIRLILEKGYDTVVEVGAYKGYRVADLKRLMPYVNVIAADLMYLPAQKDGIEFISYGKIGGG